MIVLKFLFFLSLSNEDTVLKSITESKATLTSTTPTTPSMTNLASQYQPVNNGVIDEDDFETSESPINTNFRQSKTPTQPTASATPPQTTGVDFKLDFKIEINSGKCVLHALTVEHDKQKNNSNSFSNRRQTVQPQASDYVTNFIFPAIRVKAYYESRHQELNKRLVKKANLYATIKLESFVLPQTYNLQRDYSKTKSMVISPAVLDFLEQALEPFNEARKRSRAQSSFNEFNENMNNMSAFNGTGTFLFAKTKQDQDQDEYINEIKPNEPATLLSLTSQNANGDDQVVQQSYFPVDVIVIVSIQPSTVRFTCLPHSTMECLLRLPTIDMVFSTKSLSTLNQLSNIHSNSEEKKIFEKLNFNENDSANSGGGLSVTCCMTDFSLKFYNRLAIKETNDSRYLYNEQRNYMDDKDSLSVRVGYIKFNISRTRRIIGVNSSLKNEPVADGVNMYNDVKMSVLADIGRSSFTYDMRNIKEVFVFPKYWYRRSLARRLFLGEEAPMQSHQTTNDSTRNYDEPTTPFTPIYQPDDTRRFNHSNQVSIESNDTSSHGDASHWQTLVLLSINLTELEIKMNVGNIMGHVSWLTRNARSLSKISISSFGPRRMQYSFVLDGSKLIADGGSNACMIRVQDISSFAEIDDENTVTKAPKHNIDLSVYAVECRMDTVYNQSTPILTFRLNNLSVKINDFWKKGLLADVEQVNGDEPVR
jgi:hypothetical protein